MRLKKRRKMLIVDIGPVRKKGDSLVVVMVLAQGRFENEWDRVGVKMNQGLWYHRHCRRWFGDVGGFVYGRSAGLS
jgi:hypothetical protein